MFKLPPIKKRRLKIHTPPWLRLASPYEHPGGDGEEFYIPPPFIGRGQGRIGPRIQKNNGISPWNSEANNLT